MNDKIVILGGSGVHDSPAFKDVVWKNFHTKYSNGVGDGVVPYQEKDDVIFIPRHGHGKRRYGPNVTQYAANLIAAKMLGAKAVVATSAVGSLRPENFPVGSLVIPNDYIDETGRNDNLWGVGIVVHVNPRPAFSEGLRQILYECAGDSFKQVENRGTYVTIPGDRFGTTAEGLRRSQYAHVVGMTACPEASMATQLGLHYAVAAFPVDDDTGANHEHGTVEVMRQLSAPDKVPAYIGRVIEAVRGFEPTPLVQLQGNIILGDTKRIGNSYLADIADDLIEMYCK